MADNEFKYLLTFQSTATGNGAQRTVDALNQVENSERRAAQSYGDLGKFIDSTTEKVKVSEFAFYDLDKALLKTNTSSASFTAGTTAIKKGSADASRSLLLFSQGFEDAQYGMRAVLNNIPGLIMAMGGTAGLAGAISIAAVSASVLFEWLGKTEEKATDVADRIKEVSDSMGRQEVDRFHELEQSLESSAAHTAALKQDWDETQKSQAAFAVSTLTNAEKIAKAQANIAALLGLQVDHFKELDAMAQRQAEARELAAKQAVAAENARLEKAKEAATVAGYALADAKQESEDQAGRLIAAKAELEALRAKKKELEEIAQFRLSGAGDFGSSVDPQAADKFQASIVAQKQLDDQVFQIKLQGTENRVDRLEESIKSLDAVGSGAVDKAQVALDAAQTKVTDIEKSVSINVQRITQDLDASTLVAETDQAVAKANETANQIKEAVSNLQTNNQQSTDAKAGLMAAVADGKITADEARGVSDNLRVLVGQLQTGIAGTNANMQALIAALTTLQSKVGEQAGTIRGLQQQIGAIR